jgi:hypothetical protein
VKCKTPKGTSTGVKSVSVVPKMYGDNRFRYLKFSDKNSKILLNTRKLDDRLQIRAKVSRSSEIFPIKNRYHSHNLIGREEIVKVRSLRVSLMKDGGVILHIIS